MDLLGSREQRYSCHCEALRAHLDEALKSVHINGNSIYALSCTAFVQHLSCTCPAPPCPALVLYLSCTASVLHLSCTCPAPPLSCICRALVLHRLCPALVLHLHLSCTCLALALVLHRLCPALVLHRLCPALVLHRPQAATALETIQAPALRVSPRELLSSNSAELNQSKQEVFMFLLGHDKILIFSVSLFCQ